MLISLSIESHLPSKHPLAGGPILYIIFSQKHQKFEALTSNLGFDWAELSFSECVKVDLFEHKFRTNLALGPCCVYVEIHLGPSLIPQPGWVKLDVHKL